jgi:hypothetical protein
MRELRGVWIGKWGDREPLPPRQRAVTPAARPRPSSMADDPPGADGVGASWDRFGAARSAWLAAGRPALPPAPAA